MSEILYSDDGGDRPSTIKERLLSSWFACACHPLVKRELVNIFQGAWKISIEKDNKVLFIYITKQHGKCRIFTYGGNEEAEISDEEYKQCDQAVRGESKEIIGLDRISEVL